MKKEPTISQRVEPRLRASADNPIDRVTWSLAGRRLFMTTPVDHRRTIMAKQARNAAAYYERDGESEAWQGGDIVES